MTTTGHMVLEAGEYLISGLLTDGEHHKQWYIERAILALGFSLDDLREEAASDGYKWEDGIAP